MATLISHNFGDGGALPAEPRRLICAPRLPAHAGTDAEGGALSTGRGGSFRITKSCRFVRHLPGATTAAFVSKMLAVPASAVHGVAPDDKSTIFMGFGRVYSGVLRRGDTIYVVNDAYDPSAPEEGACQEIVVEDLFLMMGQGMFKVNQVPAGNILAIGGLDKYVLKSATLSSTRSARRSET